MVALLWDQVGERVYEAGVSKGVLYTSDGVGIAWNGLINIEDGYDNKVDPVHFDGLKINDIVIVGDYSGTIRAFTYPDEFAPYVGVIEDGLGFYITGQPQGRFGLSYRTEVVTDTDRSAGYKIHVVYNLTAIATPRSSATLTLDPEAAEFEWTVTSIPEPIESYRPSSHIIFDSRKLDPFLMLDVEGILYGTDATPARLPSMQELVAYMQRWAPLVITDNGDGTWTAYSPLEDVITVDGDEFTITSDTITILDADSYEITGSEVEGP